MTSGVASSGGQFVRGTLSVIAYYALASSAHQPETRRTRRRRKVVKSGTQPLLDLIRTRPAGHYPFCCYENARRWSLDNLRATNVKVTTLSQQAPCARSQVKTSSGLNILQRG
ncbi:hypothetical protein M405DRAFT_512239 [Rhizopogon salebrosus TDB-379]|nr:hypothetical protein M405DRAFT_512239 [Rhizopogon salebrosus TDB-379]